MDFKISDKALNRWVKHMLSHQGVESSLSWRLNLTDRLLWKWYSGTSGQYLKERDSLWFLLKICCRAMRMPMLDYWTRKHLMETDRQTLCGEGKDFRLLSEDRTPWNRKCTQWPPAIMAKIVIICELVWIKPRYLAKHYF